MRNDNFANNSITNSVVNEMITKIQNGDNISAKEILESAMNLLMMAERNLHLQQNNQDKGNGYFHRKLGTPLGQLNLEVPRDRDGDFRPSILPTPYQRDYQERYNFLQAIMLNGYSPNTIKRTFDQLNLHYNPNELKQLKENYVELFQQWQKRQLPTDVIALFIDVYHSSALIDGHIKKTALYVIISIDFEGKKDLAGLYLYDGSESKAFWLQTLNHLIDRGIKCPLLIASDDFSGLKQAINTLFPNALHQLCFIHMQRNVRRNMGHNDASEFNQTLQQIKLIYNKDDCQKQFIDLCNKYESQYPTFIKALLDDTENYFAYKKFPPAIQKHFYTTNIVESVNSIIETLRCRMGGFFQSKDSLYVNTFLSIRSLQQRKWQKGIPMVKSHIYELKQLFAQLYERQPVSV